MPSADRDTTPQNHSSSDGDRQVREVDAMRAERACGCLQHGPNVPREAGQAALSPSQPLSPQQHVTRPWDARVWYNMCNTWQPQAPCREKGKVVREEGTWLLWLSWCLPNIGKNEQELWMINREPGTRGRRMQAQPATPSPVTATTDPDHFLLVTFTVFNLWNAALAQIC